MTLPAVTVKSALLAVAHARILDRSALESLSVAYKSGATFNQIADMLAPFGVKIVQI